MGRVTLDSVGRVAWDLQKSTLRDDARRQAIRDAYADLDDVVYFVRSEGLIKIGHTTNLSHRLSGLRTRPTDLLLLEPGGSEHEQELHRLFSGANRRGDGLGTEHFELTDALRVYINAGRLKMRLPAI